MKQTDLKTVQEIAIDFLHITPELNTDLALPSIFVLHPVFQSRYVVSCDGKQELVDILDEKVFREQCQAMEKGIINTKDFCQIMYKMAKPYQRTFFFYCKEYLSDIDFALGLRNAWVKTEFPHFDKNISVAEFKNLFKQADKNYLMTLEERKQIEDFPEMVIVYRGIISKKYYKALSWTLSKEIAQSFACRFDKEGVVLQAQIPKKYILAYLDTGEKEVILDYTKLENIQIIEYL